MFNDKGYSVMEFILLAPSAAREWNQCQLQAPTNQKHPPVRAPLHEDCVLVRLDAAWNEASKVSGLGWIVVSQNRVSSFLEQLGLLGLFLLRKEWR